ncbi:MAG: hypothetical protein PHD37_00845 [Gallionellaceae bacterium]|nr:hypothetical protein [Gallionellaceae bacterium]
MKTLAFMLLSVVLLIPVSAQSLVKPKTEVSASSKPAIASLARGETFITLGQTAHFIVPRLSCAEEVGKKELWLDGMDTGVRAIGCDAENEMLLFNVSRDGAGVTNSMPDVWLTLLRRPFAADTGKHFEREVGISLRENGKVLAIAQGKLKLLDKPRV